MCTAIITQQETGAALTIHPGLGDPDSVFEIVELIKAAGATFPRTIMDHNERRVADVDVVVLRLSIPEWCS
jgi:phosphotriesterase-related protein